LLKLKLNKLVSKNIIAILAIVTLATTLGISPVFADWDKQNIQILKEVFQLKIAKITQNLLKLH